MALSSSTCQEHLDNWLEADLATANGQAYTIGGRSLTRANADEITAKIQYWLGQLAIAQRRESGRRNPQVVLATWK